MAWRIDTTNFLIIFLAFNLCMLVVVSDLIGKLIFTGWLLSSIIGIILIAYLECKEHGKGAT